MKKQKILLIIGVLLVFMFGILGAVQIGHAAISSKMNYQGRLLDSSGTPVVTEKAFRFEIYGAENLGNEPGAFWLWGL